jgi:hypothetical protein
MDYLIDLIPDSMQPEDLNELNKLRKNGYYKNESDEAFLRRINTILREDEAKHYKDTNARYPFIFVFGLPRSGMTMMAQVLIKSFRLAYINNFMARFWQSPVTGIRLSKIILGDKQETSVESDYAATANIYDLHEFGYFWRYWLHIQSVTDAIQIKERAKNTDWHGLRKTLSNMQDEFDKPLCMKNIFGAYHIARLTNELPQALWVYIKRDPLDVAISILNARKKFYQDPNLWWSTAPPEYHKIKDMDYIDQIAAQVYYLNRFYSQCLRSIEPGHVFEVNYEQLCQNPGYYLEALQNKLTAKSGYELPLKAMPGKLQYRKHAIQTDEEQKLQDALNRYQIL